MNKPESIEPKLPKYLTIAQAAYLLNMKESRLKNLVFRKAIPYIKIGHSIRFAKAQLIDWVNAKTVEARG